MAGMMRITPLAVRGPTGCRYLADERQAVYVKDGWNITGDSFVMDDEGYLHFAARNDDMIISAGYNIAGPEVEAALLTHPDRDQVLKWALAGGDDYELLFTLPAGSPVPMGCECIGEVLAGEGVDCGADIDIQHGYQHFSPDRA